MQVTLGEIGAGVVATTGSVLFVVLANVDWTQISVGAIGVIGVVGAAIANNRGRKQEAKTNEIGVTVNANNDLIDQLQETLKSQIEENSRLRLVVSELDAKLQGLSLELVELRGELLRRENEILRLQKELEDAIA